jgi:N-acetylmuramoyl-L-alanine amidase
MTWQVLGRAFACVALCGVLVIAPACRMSPAWARSTGQHRTQPVRAGKRVGPRPSPARTRHKHAAPQHRRVAPAKRARHHGRTLTGHRAGRHHHAAPSPKRAARPDTRPLIVIDPGHGGKDSGAIGATGTLEKDVTLATALELRRLLKATGRYRVAMTRSTDVFISLSHRLVFARSHHAALMIAIHANASRDRGAHGASVWVRSGRTGSGQVAHLAADSGDTGKIADALVGPPAPKSAWLQYAMIDNLSDDIRMDPAPARAAHFYVLGARTIPSVLLEMGFLSNRHDEALLRKAKHRQLIARAVRDAIADYFAKMKHPNALPT